MLAAYERLIPLTMHTDIPSYLAQGNNPLQQLISEVGTSNARLSLVC